MSIDQKDFLLSASNFVITKAIGESSGIKIGNEQIRSVLLTTDIAFIQNLNSDSVVAVHPFEKSQRMDKVIVEFSNRPVFCDIGGGLLHEQKMVRAVKHSFDSVASAMVISTPIPSEILRSFSDEYRDQRVR